MDHEVDVVGELDPDDLQEVARMIRSDRKDLGRVGVGFEVDDCDGMVESGESGHEMQGRRARPDALPTQVVNRYRQRSAMTTDPLPGIPAPTLQSRTASTTSVQSPSMSLATLAAGTVFIWRQETLEALIAQVLLDPPCAQPYQSRRRTCERWQAMTRTPSKQLIDLDERSGPFFVR